MSRSSQPPPRSPRPAEVPAVASSDLAEARALHAQLDPAWFDEANDPEAWLEEPEMQRIIARILDEEMARWTGLLPPEGLRALRDELELTLVTDPVSIEYLRRIRPPGERDGSGKVKKNRVRGAKVVALPAKKAGGERP